MENINFEGYSYRVGARFGSRVNISIEKDGVSVTGPRVGVTVYQLWLAAQLMLLVVTVIFLVVALLLWSWKYLILTMLGMIIYWTVGTFGAVGFWELENLKAFGEGKNGQTVTFPRNAVTQVKIGRGWARNGIWIVILPYMAGLNKISEKVCVSFEAPDGVIKGNSVYAFHMRNSEEAEKLAKVLQGK